MILNKAPRGVDLIKLDFITPGSPSNGVNLPPDNSGEVIAWHKAIKQSGRPMRLDISWKLDRTPQFYSIWKSNADSMRTDQDINNGGASTLVAWPTVQRAIDNYRQYIVLQVPDAASTPLSIYPDMDNLLIGNPASVSGVSDIQRMTIMTHWIGAAANLIVGSDLTNLDAFGVSLFTDSEALSAADFTAKYPVQPRNPGTGQGGAQQLQAWIAGPSPDKKEAIVILANYGPDQGHGGFGTSLLGNQTVTATWKDLGLTGAYNVRNVWAHQDLGSENKQVQAVLGEGESMLLRLTRS
jgi:alpha-galactosidase